MDDHMSWTAEARYDFCIDGAFNNSQGSLSVDLKACVLHQMK